MINRFTYYILIRFFELLNAKFGLSYSRKEGAIIASVSMSGIVGVAIINLLKIISLLILPTTLKTINLCGPILILFLCVVFIFSGLNTQRYNDVYNACNSIGETERMVLLVVSIVYVVFVFVSMIIIGDAIREYSCNSGPDYIKPFVKKITR